MISHKTPLAVGSGWRAALFVRLAAVRSAATRTTSSMPRRNGNSRNMSEIKTVMGRIKKSWSHFDDLKADTAKAPSRRLTHGLAVNFPVHRLSEKGRATIYLSSLAYINLRSR